MTTTGRRLLAIGLVAILIVGGSSVAFAYTTPSLTTLYTQVAYLGFQVQNLLRSDSAQNAQIAALQAQLAAEVTNRTNADTALQNQITANQTTMNTHIADTTTAHSYDARYVRHTESGLRVVRGWVSPTGTIVNGSGFTVSHPGTGQYTVTYNSAFSAIATPVISAIESTFVWWNSAGTTQFSIQLEDENGTLVDGDFTFAVFGN